MLAGDRISRSHRSSRLLAGVFGRSGGLHIANVQLGFADFNGRAIGMNIVARAHEEGRIFQAMSAWHATFPHAWMPPPLLVSRLEQGEL